MQILIRKLFGIFPGEGKNVFRFIKLATIWAIGSCIAETLAISLFTEKIGPASLPSTYLITAITMISVSCIYMYFLRFTSPYKIMRYTMLVAAVAYSLVTIVLFTTPPRWFWFFLQIFSHSFGSALIACFWIFLDQYHDLQDAKRLFGVYNAAYFLGYIVSGTLINLTYEILGPAILFSIVIFTMIHSIIEARKISKLVPAMEDDVTEDYFSGAKRTFSSIFKEFYKSKYALYVVAMSLVVQLLRTCTEYGYLDSLDKAITSSANIISEHNIAEFLGKCKAIISAGNIIIGMFFYRNLVTRMGVANLILIPPIYFMTLYGEWMAYESLLIAIFGIVAIECILFTLEDNNFNLLINAAPQKLRGILRLINDSFFEPIGMLFSAIFLMFLKDGHKIFGLCLSMFFVILSLVVRYLYPRAIFKSLKQNKVRFERKTKDWIRKFSKKDLLETIQSLFDSLKNSENEKTKFLSFKTLLEFNDKRIFEKALLHFDSLSSISKNKTLSLIEESIFSNDSLIIEKIDKVIKYSTDDFLIKKSYLYLAKKGLLQPEKVIKDLDNKDLFLRSSAIITLKHSKAKTSLNKARAKKELQLLFNHNKVEEICMGLDILSLDKSNDAVETAIKFLSHKNAKIQKHASYALSKITDKTSSRYSETIIEEIKLSNNSEFKINCLKALSNINDSNTAKELLKLAIHFRANEKRVLEEIILKMGRKTVPILIASVKNTKLNERCRILAGKILSKLSHSHLKKNLLDIVKIEIEKAYFYFYWANEISNKYPLYDLSLLKNALFTAFQSIIDFIIHLLGAASLLEDCDLVIKALHSKSDKAHAIETLEQNIERKLFSNIKPLIDDTPLEYKLVECKKHIDSTLTLKDLLDRLENSHLFFDKIVATHLKAKLSMPNWKESLREQLKISDEAFHQYTHELLEL